MDLTSNYAGIAIRSPIVIGASPLALDIERIHDLAANGAGAIVMPSIFEEQITKAQREQMIPTLSVPAGHATGKSLPRFEPDLDAYNGGTEGYLRHIESVKSATDVPIIANINAMTSGGWMRYAKELESVGADAIELNLYHFEVDPHRCADDVETELIDRVSCFCKETKLPVAIKLLPQFTCLPNVAYRIAGAGAKSVCLFGQSPSFDIRGAGHVGYRWRLTTRPDQRFSFEAIRQVRAAVRNLTLAASGGIQTPEDALIALQLGADVVMITSAIYQQGSVLVAKIRDAISAEMTKRELSSLDELIGTQSSGFNLSPEHARRQAYSAAIAEFPKNENIPANSRLGRSPDD